LYNEFRRHAAGVSVSEPENAAGSRVVAKLLRNSGLVGKRVRERAEAYS
jgi:hypothetical protein